MLTDKQLAEIEARANAATGPRLISGHKSWAGENAVLTDEGHPVAVCGHGEQARIDAEFFAAARRDVPALLAEVKRLREELAREQEQTRVVRLIGEDNAQRAAYEAMDAERRGWQSRQAIENVTFAELKRDRDRLADRVSELTALLNDTARVTEHLRQLREMDALDGADADRDRLADGGAS